MAQKSPPLVALRWMDAHGTSTEQYEIHGLPHKALEITTFGLLLRDDEEGVSIANEYCGAGVYRGVTFVPRPLILEVKLIKPLRKATGRTRERLAKLSAPEGVTGSNPVLSANDQSDRSIPPEEG